MPKLPLNEMTVGAVVDVTLAKKYVEQWETEAKGKIIYAHDNDRMKSHYEYLVFDAAQYQAHFGSLTAGGDVTIKVTNITDKVDKCNDPKLAQPDGGFQKTYYACEIVGGGGAKKKSGEEPSEEDE